MKISEIYETSLYLAEKTDDSTGYIDNEYKEFHKKKAYELIKQAASSVAYIENIPLICPVNSKDDAEITLPSRICRNIIPYYVAAMLCKHDGEEDKYNILIYEYENAINSIKHNEENVFEPSVLEGLR